MGSTKTTEIKTEASKNEGAVEESSAKKREPKVRGQAYKSAKAKIDRQKLYSLTDAIKLVKETDIAKFNSTIEMHLVVKKEGLTAKVSLPHSTGTSKTVEVADDKTIEKLEKNNIDFDILLATAEMMPKLVKFAPVLGPRGMMPNPKNGTLLKSKADAKNFSVDDLNIKTERKAPVIHTTIGKKDMDDKKIAENAEAIFKAITMRQVVKCYLTSSMSPSVKVKVE